MEIPEIAAHMNHAMYSLIYVLSASVIQPKRLEESTSGFWGVAEKHVVGIINENIVVLVP